MKWKSLSHVQLFATLWNSQAQNTGVGSLSLLQGIFPTQGSNPGLPHRRQILYHLSYQRSPITKNTTQQNSDSDLTEKSKAFQTSKRIQHHQTSFTINAKGIFLGRKHKRRRRPTKNKSKTIKTVIGSYISIITLNVSGLNAPTKRQRLAEQSDQNMFMYILPLTISLCLIPQTVCKYIILLS